MPFPFRFLLAPSALLALANGPLAGCSSPNATSPPAEAATPPRPAFPFGGRVDSLNGLAGHAFGEPLSAFPQMRALPPKPGELTRTYAYEGTAGWFGKHQAQVPFQYYYFLNGKFCRFLAIGNAAVLRPEATYLFGPSQQESTYRLFWEGSRARAAYIETPEGFGWKGTLDVVSKPFEAEQAAQARARLQAENAQ